MAEKSPPQVMKLLVANGALLEAPIFEKHKRGSNWMAVIDIDKTSPGGLSRRFVNRGRGECLYDVDQVALFDPVEFGADYTTTGGSKMRDRWYGVVVVKTEGLIEVEKCSSGMRAVLRAKVARESPVELAAAWKASRDALLKEAATLDAAIQELESTEEPSKEASPLVVASAEVPS